MLRRAFVLFAATSLLLLLGTLAWWLGSEFRLDALQPSSAWLIEACNGKIALVHLAPPVSTTGAPAPTGPLFRSIPYDPTGKTPASPALDWRNFRMVRYDDAARTARTRYRDWAYIVPAWAVIRLLALV